MSHVPVRTCAGCGRKAPKAELVRFVEHDGRLAVGARAAGRGVYTCRRTSCFERAASRRAFSRSLRRTVSVDPALAAETGALTQASPIYTAR